MRRLSIKGTEVQQLRSLLPAEVQQALAAHGDEEGQIVEKDLKLKDVNLMELGEAVAAAAKEVEDLAECRTQRSSQYRQAEDRLRLLLEAELELPHTLVDVEAAGGVQGALAAAEACLQRFNTGTRTHTVEGLIKRCKVRARIVCCAHWHPSAFLKLHGAGCLLEWVRCRQPLLPRLHWNCACDPRPCA